MLDHLTLAIRIMILYSFGIVLTISSVSSYNKKGMIFSFSHKNNSNWDASLKNEMIKKKNRDSLISISSPLQQPPQFLPQRFCFVPSVETWRWKLCDLRGWFYNYRSDTPPSDTITENFILLLSFLIKDFCTSETRLKLYNLHCLGIFSGLRRNAR